MKHAYGLVIALILGMVSMMAESMAATEGTIEYLGVPIKAVVYGNSHGLVIDKPGGGKQFYIPYYSSSGSELVGYDQETGESIRVDLGSSGGYGLTQGADGALYVGGVNPGDMYKYDPVAKEIVKLGGSEFGNAYIWDIAANDAGTKLYGSCYPTAGILEYDTESKQMRWLGSVQEGEQYARAVRVAEDGKVWAGVGTHAHLMVLDPETGEKHDVLPEKYRSNSICYSLERHGKYISALVFYVGDLLIFDTATEEVVKTLPPVEGEEGWLNARGGDENTFYLYSYPGNSLYRYELDTDTLTLLVDRLGICYHVVNDRYAYATNDQDLVIYDFIEKKQLAKVKLAESKDGMNVMCLTAGENGHIYGPTYINMHLFGYKPETGGLHDLGRISKWGGQGDSISRGRDGKILIGAYVRATVNVYDPGKPWNFGDDADSNPRCYGPIGAGQYRTKCIAEGPDGMLYVGSIPSYNSAPSGAFSRVNPVTGEKTNWIDLVPGGAVYHCVSDDRYVYGAGGGKFFVWDPWKNEKVYESGLAVTSMVMAPNGNVVMASEAGLKVFCPETLDFVAEADISGASFTAMVVASDGYIYGINGAEIVQIDPADWSIRQIASEGGSFLAADLESNLYFARGPKLYRLKR